MRVGSVWGVSVQGGLCPGGFSVQGGLCPGGLCPGGSLSVWGPPLPPPREQNVKTLPGRNFVAGGNNLISRTTDFT